MNLKKFSARFREMRSNYIGPKFSFVQKLFYMVDYVFAFIIHGASISDYFAYGFYKLRYNGRKEYITYRRYHVIQNKCNKISDRCLCREKNKFNNLFKEFLGRDWLDINNSNEMQFVSFCRKYPVIFIKEINGYRGIGTRKVETENLNAKKMYDELISDTDSHYIAEEQITQIRELSDFHPWSINTIRIVTLFDNKNDKVHIMNARLRVGNEKNSVDNLHFGGIGANIDISTGIINSEGRDAKNKIYISHPITGKVFPGFEIPYWKDCITYIEKAARLLPTVRYVGWDVVIKENGTFLLIEANDNADHDFQQLFCGGLWKQYKSIIQKF